MAQKEYVLGTGEDELERLGIQHRVWSEYTNRIWKKAGITEGTTVLDLGCGPGYTTFDIAALVGRTGKVVGVDESESFVNFVTGQAAHRGLSNVDACVADAHSLSTQFNAKFDVVFCRWVLCWLKDPQLAIQEIYRSLKPGGRLVIHDYFNWKSMNIGPRSASVEAMVLAAERSFRDRSGNVDLAGELPTMLNHAKFSLTHFDCIVRIAKGGGTDPTLDWPLTWWRTYGPKLVQSKYLDESIFVEAAKDLDSLENDSNQFFFCPPLFEFIAEKS